MFITGLEEMSRSIKAKQFVAQFLFITKLMTRLR